MRRVIHISIFNILFISLSAQNVKTASSYRRFYKNEPAHGDIYLFKDGTFLTQLLGGCDGRIESKGKWKINKDTLSFTEVEHRMMNDPWKKSDLGPQFIMKKGKLIPLCGWKIKW